MSSNSSGLYNGAAGSGSSASTPARSISGRVRIVSTLCSLVVSLCAAVYIWALCQLISLLLFPSPLWGGSAESVSCASVNRILTFSSPPV